MISPHSTGNKNPTTRIPNSSSVHVHIRHKKRNFSTFNSQKECCLIFRHRASCMMQVQVMNTLAWSRALWVQFSSLTIWEETEEPWSWNNAQGNLVNMYRIKLDITDFHWQLQTRYGPNIDDLLNLDTTSTTSQRVRFGESTGDFWTPWLDL